MITLSTVCIVLTNCMQVFLSKWPSWKRPSWLFGGACDKELQKLKKALTKLCVKHDGGGCQNDAATVLQHGGLYPWGESMVTGGIRTRVPVFWAGFSEHDIWHGHQEEPLRFREGCERASAAWRRCGRADRVGKCCPGCGML